MRAQLQPAERDRAEARSAVAFRSGRGDDFGRWRPLELLGAGGTARVWRAVDGSGRAAALKIPDAHATDLLWHEHSLLEQLSHPNVVATFGIARSETSAALVLEYLPGGDLVSLAGAPARHWLRAVHGVLRALRALHARGIAHCDVKARNVLFAADGSPRLIDFATARGLDARLRRSIATAACTPAGDDASGAAADCFAFAALIHELATGRLPYGERGMRWVGEAPAGEARGRSAAGPLLTLAIGVLQAGGQVQGGLSAFADGIESALDVCA
jgi:serine/threonine protein kinase